MRSLRVFSLAILLLAVGPLGAADITVYRCQDAKGVVSLQDQPCPAGQTGSSRSMVRPQDPPPRPIPQSTRDPEPPADAGTPPPADPAAYAPLPYPPPLFQCTDYDGDVRYSEDYDPNQRCVPLSVLGYDTYGSAATCRWVTESCVRLDDRTACARFRERLVQARSDALHAFSDKAAFRTSEVRRLEQIVADGCR